MSLLQAAARRSPSAIVNGCNSLTCQTSCRHKNDFPAGGNVLDDRAIFLFCVSVKRMLGGYGDVLYDLPHWRYTILGNFINHVKRGSRPLNL